MANKVTYGSAERINVMLELENESLRSELLALRRFIDSMQNLSDATEAPRSNDQIMDLLEDVLDQARQAINAKDGSLLVLDEDTDELVFVITKGDIPSEELIWRRIPPGEGIAGWVVREQRPTIVNNTRADDRFWDTLDGELGFYDRLHFGRTDFGRRAGSRRRRSAK